MQKNIYYIILKEYCLNIMLALLIQIKYNTINKMFFWQTALYFAYGFETLTLKPTRKLSGPSAKG